MVSELYKDIQFDVLALVKLVSSCKENLNKVVSLSEKMLHIMKRLKSNSLKIEGSFQEEIEVLGEKLNQFLSHPENEKELESVLMISKRIYQEVSSY